MLKIAICDDEPYMCEMLKQKTAGNMASLKQSFCIECFTSSKELISSAGLYDILLLDIQMPGLSGIELSRQVRDAGHTCCVIFITALKDYVYDAFEVSAVDYILKPVDNDRLMKALTRAVQNHEKSTCRSLLIQTMNWTKSVKFSSIFYCEIINRKLYLHTDQEVIEYYGKISEIEKQLDYRFIRCHRSFLVNLDYLYEYTDNHIILDDGSNIPVSRLRRQECMRQILEYMKQKGKQDGHYC